MFWARPAGMAVKSAPPWEMVVVHPCQCWFGIPQNRWFGIPQIRCSVRLLVTSCGRHSACARLTRLAAEGRATLESDPSAAASPV